MARVIIDTSSMLFGFSYGKDVFSSAREQLRCEEIIISNGVLRELRGIAANAGKRGAAAKVALGAISAHRPKIDGDNGSVDDWIARKAKGYKDAVVITNDTELLKRLKGSGDGSGLVLFKLSRSGILREF